LRTADVRIDADEALALMTGGALVLDVRRPDDRSALLDGSERVPPDQIPGRIAALPRGSPILLACT
jgi:rhodanese-related sulfurtransferase